MIRFPLIQGLAVATAAFCLVAVGVSNTFAASLAQSASKVDVVAAYAHAAGSRHAVGIRVELRIADGWHVNANPASLAFLVPTTIKATADGESLPLNIAWPDGRDSGIELDGNRIKVYGDGTIIALDVDAAVGAQPTLAVRVQACSDDGLCLPPSTLTVQPRRS